jgi:hypothetical protein
MALSCTRAKGEYITLRHDGMIIPIKVHKLYLDAVGLRIPESIEGLHKGPCAGQGELYIIDLGGEPLSLHLEDAGVHVSLSVREVRDSWARISVDAPRSVGIDKSGEHPDDQEDTE